MKTKKSPRQAAAKKPKAAESDRARRAEKRLAEAEKRFAPFTEPIEYPWISTHDKWGLGDAASIRTFRVQQ